jgi:hypothetical protein
MTSKKYLSYIEMAKLFKVSRMTVCRVTKENNFKKIWQEREKGVGGHGRWLVSVESYLDYINQFNK